MARLLDWLRWQRVKNGGPRERLVCAIAWRLPRSLAYWTAIRVIANASQVEEGRTQVVDTITPSQVLQRWSK